jgi:hypothetical protein
VSERYRLVSCAGLPKDPDGLAEWIRLDLLTRRVIGRRMEQGPTPESDEEPDKADGVAGWWRGG